MWRSRPKIAALLLLPVVAATIFIPAVSSQVYAGEVLVPAEWRKAHPGPYTITVAVVVDEEWTASFGADALEQAYAVIAAADRHFEPAEIHLRPVLFDAWTSDDSATSIQDLLQGFARGHDHSQADIVVALTGQYRGREGGIADADHRHILVKRHPYRLDRDAFIVAHEIGHALGLRHHRCPHRYCIMSDHDYDPEQHWCPDHYRLLEKNGGLFQYLSDAQPPA